MQFLAHRGFWKTNAEQNTLTAFEKAFSNGFGIEFDIRDHNGALVIAHDIPEGENLLLLREVLNLYKKHSPFNTLAVNMKADGLMEPVKKILLEFAIDNFFLFDMSIPETIRCKATGLPFFSRQSEYEPEVYLYKECKGVWLDCFISVWYNTDLIKGHLNNGKQVAIVSPDLHKREYMPFWESLKDSTLQSNKNLFLCTDFPDKARGYFGNKDQ
jgi:hypothetical protein